MKYFLIQLFIFKMFVSYTQSDRTNLIINDFKNNYHITDSLLLSFQLDSNYSDGYAFGVPISRFFVTNQFYFFESLKNSNCNYFLRKNNGKETLEIYQSIQHLGYTSFQIENNSTWVLENDNNWTIFTLDMLRNNNANPVKYSKTEFDSISLLDSGIFLSIKGNKKWINEIDSLGNIVSDEIQFEGNTFFQYNGGIIAPVFEDKIKKYRYIQYANHLSYDESLGDNIPDPNFHYLKPDGKFVADEIIQYPSRNFDYVIIKSNNKLQVHSFNIDSIIEPDIVGFCNYNGEFLIYTNNYIATEINNKWQKLEMAGPTNVSCEMDGGDIPYAQITLRNGNTVTVDLFDFKIVSKE